MYHVSHDNTNTMNIYLIVSTSRMRATTSSNNQQQSQGNSVASTGNFVAFDFLLVWSGQGLSLWHMANTIPIVILPTSEHHHPLTGTMLYCLGHA